MRIPLITLDALFSAHVTHALANRSQSLGVYYFTIATVSRATTAIRFDASDGKNFPPAWNLDREPSEAKLPSFTLAAFPYNEYAKSIRHLSPDSLYDALSPRHTVASELVGRSVQRGWGHRRWGFSDHIFLNLPSQLSTHLLSWTTAGGRLVHHPPAETLAIHNTDLDFRHVQPTRVRGCVVEHDSSQKCVGSRCAEHLVEALAEMRIEVVENQVNLSGGGVGALKHYVDLHIRPKCRRTGELPRPSIPRPKPPLALRSSNVRNAI